MADDEKTTDEEDTDEEDDSTDESDSEGEEEDAGASKADTGEESDDDDDSDDEEGSDAGDDKGGKKSDDDAEPEVPVRKTVDQQNIIARKNRTIDKLRKKDDDDSDEGDDDGDDDLIPSAAKGVQKEVKKALAPVMEHLSTTADENDVKDLYSNEPDAKKFDRAIRAYMKHPAYKGVPPEVIYHHLAFGTAQATGAKKKSVADKEAGRVRGAGNTKKSKGFKGNIPSTDDLNNMSEKDFEALQNDVLQGKYRAS